MIAATIPGPSLTILEYIDRYELLRPLSPSRRNQYRYSVRALSRFAKYDVPLSELCDDLINRWLLDLRRRGLTPRTIKSYRMDVLVLWRSAAADGLAVAPRRICPAHVPEMNPDAWTPGEVHRLLAAADELPGYFRATGIKCSVWWCAFILVGWDTGLRFTDMFRFRGSDILNGGELLLIQHKTGLVHRARLQAENMADWERSALRCNFTDHWRTIRERGWIPWNHRRDDVKPDAVSLVYLSSPSRDAARELDHAMAMLAAAGIQLLGSAATNCNHVAAAFVWANHRAVEALLSDWKIMAPPGRWE